MMKLDQINYYMCKYILLNMEEQIHNFTNQKRIKAKNYLNYRKLRLLIFLAPLEY